MIRVLKHLWLLLRRTAQEYSADNCSHMAAAISYYILFSIVPLVIFTVSVFGLVVRDAELQQDVSEEIVDFVNLESGDVIIEPKSVVEDRFGPDAELRIRETLTSEDFTQEDLQAFADTLDEGDSVEIAGFTLTATELRVRRDNIVTDTIEGVSQVSGALTVVGLIGMAWSASAMFGAIRKSLNIAWDAEIHRPIVQQKALDLAMVLGLGVLLGASLAGTTAIRVVRELSEENLGPLSTGTGFLWSIVPLFLPAVFSFMVFLFIYRFVPNAPTSVRTVWPGALLATVLFELLKNAFALYIAEFNSYDLAYGALGGVLLFMLWAYLTSNVLLVGAEIASEYPRVMRGDYDEPETEKEDVPLKEKARRMAKGLFVHPERPERQPPPKTKS